MQYRCIKCTKVDRSPDNVTVTAARNNVQTETCYATAMSQHAIRVFKLNIREDLNKKTPKITFLETSDGIEINNSTATL